jgi:hypothetical protein
MITGILLNGANNLTLSNVWMNGLDVGVDIVNSSNVTMNDVSLKTLKGIVGEGVKNFKANNVIHDDSTWSLRPTRIAIAVREVIVNGYV